MSASEALADDSSASRALVHVSASHSPFVRKPSAEHPAVHFVIDQDSDRHKLTLYLQREVNPVFGPGGSAETGVFESLCQLPCDVSLRSGSYVFGLAAGSGPTVKFDEALSARDGEEVRVRYDRRLGMRIAGWALILAGTVAGAVMLGFGQSNDRPVESVLGGVLGGLSIAGGLWLANVPDRAHGELSR
jgi:hypothetical protein